MTDNYHVTENKYLESILNEGLIPQQGIRSNLIGDPKTAIFYSKGYEGVIAMFFMMIERYIEYRSAEGDIHIDSYNIIKKMIETRQTRGETVGEYLRERFEIEAKIIESISVARKASDYKEFLGEGVCLKIGTIPKEHADLQESTFYNSWTTTPIPPDNISIVALENKETGQVLSSKYDVINFFISKVPLEEMKKSLYDNPSRENERESSLLWKIMSNYYNDNKSSLEKFFEKYNLIEISIPSYLDKKSNAK